MPRKKKQQQQSAAAGAPAQTKSNSVQMAASASRSAAILALLQRPEGATLEQMEASGWQKHSVRGFIAGALKKRHGGAQSNASLFRSEGRLLLLGGRISAAHLVQASSIST